MAVLDKYVLRDKTGLYWDMINSNEFNISTDNLEYAGIFTHSEISEVKERYWHEIVRCGIMPYRVEYRIACKVGLENF